MPRARVAPACAGGKVNLRRGFLRLGSGLVVLWFVFWTAAYVLSPRSSENAPVLPVFSPMTNIVLVAAAIVGMPWVAAGFRKN